MLEEQRGRRLEDFAQELAVGADELRYFVGADRHATS